MSSNPAKWIKMSCEYFEEIQELQSSYYWSTQINSSTIVILYAIVCSFGAFANLLVFLAFLKTPMLRNIRNAFIVNLAISDFLLCSFTAPATLYLFVNLYWPFGEDLCKIVASLQATNTFVSSLTLALIAVDRVLLTLCPIKWRVASTGPSIFYGLVWLISILVAAPYGLAVSAVVPTFTPWSMKTTASLLEHCDLEFPVICREDEVKWRQFPVGKLGYTTIVFGVQYLLPLTALLYAYLQIGTTIKNRSKVILPADTRRRSIVQSKKRKALILLAILVLIYAVAWAPANLYSLFAGFQLITYSQPIYIFCHLIGISSACVNPIIYALVNENFRTAFREMFWWLPFSSRHRKSEEPTNCVVFSNAKKIENNHQNASVLIRLSEEKQSNHRESISL
ncbi:unnamed protein product, partial [Mesorhabditis belari]|uniref:G-protein coupled receptors family 1 profile domain-containing protein n=1 Tax=Mesorhabditis belari TaxID=2138241 RepID=A0AAF3FIC7_9BILA